MSIKLRKESDFEAYDLEGENFDTTHFDVEEQEYEQDQKSQFNQQELNRDKNTNRTQKDHASHQQNYTDTHKSAGSFNNTFSQKNLAQHLDQDLSVQGMEDQPRFQHQSNQNRVIGNQNSEEHQQDQERGHVA